MSNGGNTDSTSLVNIIETAIQVPGVKVNRASFLVEQFKHVTPEMREKILNMGPAKAQCSKEELRRMAKKLVNERTLVSSGASFAAGLPGGLAMAATIPADMLQFYGVALRLAQEIAYLYGEEDLWCEGCVDPEKVTNQLIIYCGVMLGASGASQTVRVLSSSLAKQALKKLPRKALTKTFYYPIVKSIAKAVGAKMTKEVFAKGVSKALPIIGGVMSGGITLVTMRPMGMRLVDALEEAHFDYSQKDFEADWKDIIEECGKVEDSDIVVDDAGMNVDKNFFGSVFDELNKAKKMLDNGVITEEEFIGIKEKLIAKL